MGLIVNNISLVNFRNFRSLSVDFSQSITILVGHNAVGKTNTIEALQMLTAGYSFRKPTPVQLILEGEKQSKIHAQLTGDKWKEMSCN